VHGKAIDPNMQLSSHKLGQFIMVENPSTSCQQWFTLLESKLHDSLIDKASY
jgi:hypothetical protein